MGRSTRNSTPQDNPLGAESDARCAQYATEFRAELFVRAPGFLARYDGTGDVLGAYRSPRVLLVDTLNGESRDVIVNDAVSVRKVPYLSTGWHARTFRENFTFDGECRAHTGSEGNADDTMDVPAGP